MMDLGYPRSIFLIVATEFCERFSFCGLRTILSLYLRNILLYHENNSTLIYHVFMMVCFLVPLFGGLLADSCIGRFRTILYFCIIYAAGNILMCIAAIPPASPSPVLTTMLGLTLIAIGTGGIKPCVATFGGDQFSLPEQEALLQQFFPIFYFIINLGGLMGMIITPILRKSVTCFGDDTCYALGVGFPAALMIIAFILFAAGKPFYRIKKPKENIILNCIKCASFAVSERFRRRNRGKVADHWLDFAHRKFDKRLIRDMKRVLSVMYIFIPLPIFWSLFDQQGSRWTFQASRMDGEIAGIHILPDQMQVTNPVIVMLLIPLLDKVIFPWLEARFRTTALHKMLLGGCLAAMSFVASGFLEMALESSYPVLPRVDEAHVNIINTLPCDIEVMNPFNKYETINSTQNHVFRNVSANNLTSYQVLVFAPYKCGDTILQWSSLELNCLATEAQFDTVVIGKRNKVLKSFMVDPDDLRKSLSGKPKIRIIFLQDTPSFHKAEITLRSKKNFTDTYFAPPREMSVSAYMELDPGKYVAHLSAILCLREALSRGRQVSLWYTYSVSYGGHTTALYEEDIVLLLGGVYSLVVIEDDGQISFSKIYVMTPPNTMHMMWLLPQYVLISIGEVMFAVAGLQFTFTQAPKSMKTVTLAGWYFSVAVGNLIVIIVTQSKLVKTQANEFFLFAGLLLLDMLLFVKMTTNYVFADVERDGSSMQMMVVNEEVPLIQTASDSED